MKIQIPWTSLYNSPTVINIQGLYMLMVPTTSVGYDKEKEEKAEYEAKMAKITAIEEAKKNKLLDQKGDDNDGFIQKVLAPSIEFQFFPSTFWILTSSTT